MRLLVPAFLCLAVLLFGSSVWGQTPEEKDSASYFGLEEDLLRKSDDPALRSTHAGARPALILETTKDGDTRVKARVGVEFGKDRVLDLQVESPRNKTSERTTLATPDGLTNSTTAEVGLTWVLWKPEEYATAMLKDLRNTQESTKLLADWKSRTEPYRSRGFPRPSARAVLGDDGYEAALKASEKALKGWIPVFLTVRAKAGPEEFRFVDASTLAAGKESHTNRLFTASAGAYLQGSFYTSLSYSRGTAFTAGQTKDLCTPFGAINALECRSVTVGPPAEAKTEALNFEIRRMFRIFGLAGRLTRDLKNHVTEVEVPIYFQRSMGMSEMELNGGISVKWRSDTRDYALTAFIGPALSTVFRR